MRYDGRFHRFFDAFSQRWVIIHPLIRDLTPCTLKNCLISTSTFENLKLVLNLFFNFFYSLFIVYLKKCDWSICYSLSWASSLLLLSLSSSSPKGYLFSSFSLFHVKFITDFIFQLFRYKYCGRSRASVS